MSCCADSSRCVRLIPDSCTLSRTFAVPCLGRTASSRNTVAGIPLPYHYILRLHQAGSKTCQISENYDIFGSLLRTCAVPGTHKRVNRTARSGLFERLNQLWKNIPSTDFCGNPCCPLPLALCSPQNCVNGGIMGVSHLLHIHYIEVFFIMFCSVPEFMNSVTSADKYFIA